MPIRSKISKRAETFTGISNRQRRTGKPPVSRSTLVKADADVPIKQEEPKDDKLSDFDSKGRQTPFAGPGLLDEEAEDLFPKDFRLEDSKPISNDVQSETKELCLSQQMRIAKHMEDKEFGLMETLFPEALDALLNIQVGWDTPRIWLDPSPKNLPDSSLSENVEKLQEVSLDQRDESGGYSQSSRRIVIEREDLEAIVKALKLLLNGDTIGAPESRSPRKSGKPDSSSMSKNSTKATPNIRTDFKAEFKQNENSTPLPSPSSQQLRDLLQQGYIPQPRASTILLSKLPLLHKSFTGQSADEAASEFKSYSSSLRNTGHRGCSLFAISDIASSEDETASESSITSSSTEDCDNSEELDIIGRAISRKRFAEHLGRYFQSFPAFGDYQSPEKPRVHSHENTEEDLPQNASNSSPGTLEVAKLPSQACNAQDQGQEDENEQRSDDEDSDSRKRKRRKKNNHCNDSGDLLPPQLRPLACPYYQRDPRKYRHQRGCAGPGWKSVHRLKQDHLKKFHFKYRCLRCGHAFINNNGLKDHSLMETACRIKRPLEDFEYFNQDQLERLQLRLKGTEEEKWKKMYHILFPDDDTELAPSPYYDDSEEFNTEDYMAYQSFSQQEFERQFFSELDRRMNQDFRLRQQFEDIITSVWRLIPPFLEWMRTRRSSNDESSVTRRVPIGSLSGFDMTYSMDASGSQSGSVLQDNHIIEPTLGREFLARGSTPLQPEIARSVITPSDMIPTDSVSGYHTLSRIQVEGKRIEQEWESHSTSIDLIFDFEAYSAAENQTDSPINGPRPSPGTEYVGIEEGDAMTTTLEEAAPKIGKRKHRKSKARA